MKAACMSKGRLFVVAGLLGVVALAQAGAISNVIFRIEATNAAGWGYKEFTANDLTYNAATNQWVWSTGAWEIPENGIPGGTPIAELGNATVGFVKDPATNKPYYIGLGFEVVSGDSLTRFVVKSGWVQFTNTLPASLLNGVNGGGRATAQLGVSDLNGNGVALLGYGPVGIGAYRALYNETTGPVTLTSLVNTVQNTTGGSGSGSQTFPSSGTYGQINDSVADMASKLDFTLTAGDMGSGTTTYRILPEPATVAVLALLGFVVLRRR
jgi:hypothetical protein